MFFRQYFGNHAAFEEYLTAAVWLTNIDIKLHPIKADDARDDSVDYEDRDDQLFVNGDERHLYHMALMATGQDPLREREVGRARRPNYSRGEARCRTCYWSM
jgi:hypothetical protein